MAKTKIALDTNIWIYLTKSQFKPLYDKLVEAANNGEVDILVNDIIIKEWDRNKPATIKSLEESINADYKATERLAKLTNNEAIINILSDIKSKDKRGVLANIFVEEVELFMRSRINVEVLDSQKLHVSNMAIDKCPPFQNNKNNFNDVLLVRNFAEYCIAENVIPYKYDLIYVSNNLKDFCDIDGHIYVNILQGLDNVSIKSVSELGEALRLAPELIDDFDDWLDCQLNSWIDYQVDLARGK